MEKRTFDQEIFPLRDSLYRMALSILQSADEAQDAVQDVLMQVWEKRSELSKVENTKAFVYRSVRNKSLDIVRKRRTSSDDFDGQISENLTPYEQTEQQDMANRIKQLIEQLPELQRSVIQMRDIEQMEIEEIAYICDITPNAVSVNLSRARGKIRTQLIKENKVK